jgi:tetratricopeptide (TPR) repeat protein
MKQHKIIADKSNRLFHQALQLQQHSKLNEAKALYEKILHQDPHHCDALHLLGMIYHTLNQKDQACIFITQALTLKPHPIYYNSLGIVLKAQGKIDEAIDAFTKALALNPNYAGMYHNLGNALRDKGKIDEAIEALNKALSLEPQYVEAYYNLGVTLYAKGQIDEAIEAFTKALSISPNHADIYYSLGIALQNKGELDEAIKAYTKALSINPNYAEAHNNLGVTLHNKGKIDHAIEVFIKALSINPNYADAYYNLGNALQNKNKINHAMTAYEKAISLDPNYVDAYNNLGVILKVQGKLEEAIKTYTKALMINPNHAGIYNNFGTALKAQGKLDEAIDAYTKALSLDLNYTDAYNNLGNALYDSNKVDESLKAYAKALSLDPNHADALWNQSLTLLLSGNFLEGFKHYEHRWDVEGGLQKFRRNFSQPLWLGEEDISGKTILIHAEQGLGDTLQFCRYIEMLAQQGAHVIFEVQKPLIRLLQGISTLIEKGSALPEFDYHCPLLSLPHAFHTSLKNVPNKNPYIEVERTLVDRWKQKLGERRTLRVGLVWNGGFRANQPELWYANNRRNIPLELIVKLNRVDVDFYSLQKGEPAESEFKRRSPDLWKSDNLFNYMDDVEDFADTAGLISQLDLVIAVDTSTAHLAAAMGKPVWLLNRFDTCWRWMLNREDSPWYPTLTLFRQPSLGDWESVIQKVRDRLDALVMAQTQG